MIRFELTPEEKRENPYWVVSLSDGREIYQCDYDEFGAVNSWRELKVFVNERGLDIAGMWLRFRDHSEEIGVGKSAYFFINSVIADAFSGYHKYFYVCGTLEDDGKVHTKKWMIPEVMSLDEDVREMDSNGMAEMLIVNTRN